MEGEESLWAGRDLCVFLFMGAENFSSWNRRRAKQVHSEGLHRREGRPLNSTGDNNNNTIAPCELKLFTDIRPLSPAFFTVLLLGYTVRWPPGSLTPLPRRGPRSLVNMIIVKLPGTIIPHEANGRTRRETRAAQPVPIPPGF